jgi:hypothetical protein
MRTFVCNVCGNTLHFENDTCLKCTSRVGFCADEMTMVAVHSAEAAGLQPCRNWSDWNACNWFTAGAIESSSEYCLACGFDEVVPNLGDPQRLALWTETERAKRRLIFTLLQLQLPLRSSADKRGLSFRLLADERVDTGALEPPTDDAVVIGHDRGRLTLNVVEADDAHREAMRKRLDEPYRTMLGHLRHESGHYYFYRLIENTPSIDGFRAVFGDERADYSAALSANYAHARDDWQTSFVSAYASAHPWEDFAETWAHYIHIVDTLETASDVGLRIGGRNIAASLNPSAEPLTATIGDWLALSVALNQLNRSMGMRDAYPFTLSDRVIEKLAFVRQLCAGTAQPSARALLANHP